MSWDGYVKSLMDTCPNAITKGSIVGLTGAVWTPGNNSNIMNIAQPEAATIGKNMSLKDPKKMEEAFAPCGVVVEGVKYQFLRIDPEDSVAIFKKKDLGMLFMKASVQAAVIGFVPEDKTVEWKDKAIAAVKSIVDYLAGTGY